MGKKEQDSPSFEEMLQRVEEIAGSMDDGGLTLEQSMNLYEEGIEKIETLTSMLNDVREKVMKLVQDSEGKQALEHFESGEDM